MLKSNSPILAEEVWAMKVKKESSLKNRLLMRIKKLDSDVIVRADIDDLSDFRQLSRAIKALIDGGFLVRISFGVYAKAGKSEYTGNTILTAPFDVVAKEALNKLGVKWELTSAQVDYNQRKSTQIPAKPAVRLKSRCRRTFSFQNAKLYYERKIYAK